MISVGLFFIAGHKIGSGHLFRCVALHQWLSLLNKKIRVEFYHVGSMTGDQKHPCSILSKYYGIICNEFNGKLEEKIDIAFIDCLNIRKEVFDHVRESAEVIVLIDNTTELRAMVDFSINPLYIPPAITRIKNKKLISEFTGINFQIIRPEFFDTKSKFNCSVENIAFFQGGGDPHDLLPRICHALGTSDQFKKHNDICLHFVVGPSLENFNNIKSAATRLPQKVFIHQEVVDMPSFLSQLDVAVSSSGITPFELSAVGIPTLLITGENKEKETARLLHKNGSSIFFDADLASGSSSDFVNKLLDLILDCDLRLKLREKGFLLMSSETIRGFLTCILNHTLSNIKNEIGEI